MRAPPKLGRTEITVDCPGGPSPGDDLEVLAYAGIA
jgi:hypothetical protein